jgi:endonuclease/exonuclease/phosphatase family metal-dependent hydrolase
MRLMTYNIHGWRTADGAPNLDQVTDVIRAIGPDIIGLNEAFYPRVVEGAAEPALEALANRLGFHFVFGPCLRWPAQDDMPGDAFGNALLSRWPIIASAAHHLTPKEPDLAAQLAGLEQRGLLEGRILLPDGRTFTVYVTHLDYSAEESRLIQLRTLRTWTLRDRNRPHVVMGDFNAISHWDFAEREEALAARTYHRGNQADGGLEGPRVIAQMEKAGYVDLYRQFGVPGRQSYIDDGEPIRIDYIFGSQPLAPHAQHVEIWQEPPGEEASDHRPVVADVALPVQNASGAEASGAKIEDLGD